jgi:large subunit ribosomal protein L10
MPNIVNRLVVSELTSELAEVEGLYLVSFHGLSVDESESIRNQLAEKGASFRMVRNSLARRVFAERGLEFDGEAFLGNTAIAYGSVEATVSAAKVLTSPEVKKAKKVKVKAALLEGRVLGAQEALMIADMPDQDTLRAQLLGCISGPARGLVSTLNGLPSGLARVLQARADKLEAAG